MEHPFHLQGKNILITGASSGIGRQCAISCSALGANLILFGRNMEALNATELACHPAVKKYRVSVDMQAHEAMANAVRESVGALGKIDGVIHCAGISTTLPLRMIRPDKLRTYLEVNVIGAIELTRLLVKPAHFAKTGGSIVFISSVMAQVGERGKTIYSITKGAVEAGVRSLALELAGKHIRVNGVAPGVVETPMSEQAAYSQNTEALERITAMHPLGLGQTTDVANGCIYLLSDASRWVTGTTLTIDGGYTAH
ncbi:SDR family NAD(P)-dependent oxidoreductase [Lewinella cohaerens]|uniref:SDR family NAD(P)-dependent oxidoreductase n=1 Tax=Lewinella cohaerens TaxID=70995 RepID=UPI00037583F4|nr:SDR family oxidoreductase [Lewinella cohaerens]